MLFGDSVNCRAVWTIILIVQTNMANDSPAKFVFSQGFVFFAIDNAKWLEGSWDVMSFHIRNVENVVGNLS